MLKKGGHAMDISSTTLPAAPRKAPRFQPIDQDSFDRESQHPDEALPCDRYGGAAGEAGATIFSREAAIPGKEAGSSPGSWTVLF